MALLDGEARPARDLDAEILDVGTRLAKGSGAAAKLKRAPQEKGMALLGEDPQLKAAMFKLVDVAPACDGPRELAEHLEAFLSEVEAQDAKVSLARRASAGGLFSRVTGRVASAGIAQMAHRFIVGETPQSAAPELSRLWRQGSAVSVDLLGEATVTPQEGERYAARCHDALTQLARVTRDWPARPVLEADSAGPLPRVNLSVKVTALTPLIRAHAPERGREDAARHLRALLRRAQELGAHLHIDMESMDSRDMVFALVLDLLAEDEFRRAPSAGIVLQAYLRDSEALLDEVLRSRAVERDVPLTVRLVKGAYWDHEVIDAVQHGWSPPVWTTKAESDRCFERLSATLIDAFPTVRPAIASHNLRSVAHAIVHARRRGLATEDLELQVLRGLGDDLQDALAAEGYRGRTYCPVGDLVSGMAYLVRRLLENTANDSFLASTAAGADLTELLQAP